MRPQRNQKTRTSVPMVLMSLRRIVFTRALSNKLLYGLLTKRSFVRSNRPIVQSVQYGQSALYCQGRPTYSLITPPAHFPAPFYPERLSIFIHPCSARLPCTINVYNATVRAVRGFTLTGSAVRGLHFQDSTVYCSILELAALLAALPHMANMNRPYPSLERD